MNAIGPQEAANGVHPNQISTWKRAAIVDMTTAFIRRSADPGKGDSSDAVGAGLPRAQHQQEAPRAGSGQNLVVKRPALRRLAFCQGQRPE